MTGPDGIDVRRPAIERLAVFGEALGAVATLGLAVLAIVTVRPGRLTVGLVIGLALAWSTAGLLADLLARRARTDRARTDRAQDASTRPDDAPPATVTTLVRLGDEPPEIARAVVLVALEGGPVALLARNHRPVPEDLERLAPLHRAPTIEEAATIAVRTVTTDAVLFVSGRAAPRLEACRDLADRLDPTTAWAVGRTEPFSQDGFAPDGRGAVGSRLRNRARDAGLDLWEPDATIVRSETLREHPLRAGRPWGTWLRERRAEGLTGVTTPQTLAFRSTPADAESFWPDTVARQRAAAADLARATAVGRPTSRLLAALLLARELYAVPLLGWLVLPIFLGVSGEYPFALSAAGSTGLVAILLVLRWVSLRASLGVPRRAADDLLSAQHHLPGSLAAVPATVTSRLRPMRAAVPTRPLVWAALLLTVLAGASLVDREPGAPASKLSVGTALVTLALLWAFTMRSLIRRSWNRRSSRIPVNLEVTVAGASGHTVDCSPTGLAISGPIDGFDTDPGAPLDLRVRLDDGRTIELHATVAGRRRRGDSVLLGLALSGDDDSLGPWLTQVVQAAGRAGVARPHGTSDPLPTSLTVTERDGGGRLARSADRVVHGLVALASAALVATLALVILGFQPLVIRSASMVPTFGIGDVVLSEQVRAADLEPGDVVTQPDHLGPAEAMTHRVVGLRDAEGSLAIETRGDANRSSEVWVVASEDVVGRVRWSVPWIGRVASGVRTSGVQLALALGVVALIVATMLRPQRHGGPGRAAPIAPA